MSWREGLVGHVNCQLMPCYAPAGLWQFPRTLVLFSAYRRSRSTEPRLDGQGKTARRGPTKALGKAARGRGNDPTFCLSALVLDLSI